MGQIAPPVTVITHLNYSGRPSRAAVAAAEDSLGPSGSVGLTAAALSDPAGNI